MNPPPGDARHLYRGTAIGDRELRDYMDERWLPTMINRVHTGAAIALAGVAVFIGLTLGPVPALVAREYAVLALLCLALVSLLALPQRMPTPATTRVLIFAMGVIICSLVAWASAIAERPISSVAFDVVYVMSCAAMLPWRPRVQAGLVAAAALGIAGNLFAVTGGLRPWEEAPAFFVILVAVLASSVYITYELERTRLAGAAEEIARARVEERLQTANALLEQRVAERTLELQERSAELERMVRELQSFSYTISHDLRAPLRGINGFSTALREEFSDVLGRRGRDYLDHVRSATQRMGSMIDSLLALGRVTRAEVSQVNIDLSEVVRSLARDCQAADPERAVEWVIREGVNATCDPGMVHTVLQNLIENAWKFTADTAAPRIEFGAKTNGRGTVYFVSDNGPGFDMRYSDKLFRAFTRLHAQGEFEGSGVGLATAHHAVERHGGRIWAEAAPSRGATFFFTLAPDDSETVGARQRAE